MSKFVIFAKWGLKSSTQYSERNQMFYSFFFAIEVRAFGDKSCNILATKTIVNFSSCTEEYILPN